MNTENIDKDPASCSIENTGKVNCTDIIYENEESWRQSRHQVDMLIKVLRDKLTELKGIKKHLRKHRPAHIKDDYDESISLSGEDENLLFSSSTTPKTIKQSRPHSHSHRKNHTSHHHGHHHLETTLSSTTAQSETTPVNGEKSTTPVVELSTVQFETTNATDNINEIISTFHDNNEPSQETINSVQTEITNLRSTTPVYSSTWDRFDDTTPKEVTDGEDNESEIDTPANCFCESDTDDDE